MAEFDKYKSSILEIEGGYQNNPHDPGNYNSRGELVGTNHGISAKLYEKVIGRPPTVADMKSITKERALSIFYNWFWVPMMANKIDSQAIAETFVDHGINAGIPRAVRLMQHVLNDYFYAGLKVDGRMGPKTLAAVNASPERELFDAYNTARIDYYESLNNAHFEHGWKNRVYRLWHKYRYLGGGMAGLILLAGLIFILRKYAFP